MPVFLSFFPKNRHFEMGSNCDVLTLKRTSFSTFFVVGRSNHLPTTSAFFRQIPSVSIYTKKLEINLAAMPRGFESHRLRQRQHLAGRCFLFLQQAMQGLQGGIRTARAPRFASRGAETPRWGVSRARLGESLRAHLKSALQCTLRSKAVIVGLIFNTRQETISVSHIVMFAEKTYNAFEPVGHTKRRKERES